ncbi:MAG: hypothetical protein NTY57_03610 [Solirubrobacterales bacterium]|jgi:hypothetical protein|nr:hypothetical protein [Solirubrobacterales bacterium]
MSRKSLKPQLNQIRAWVQQGRTDAWIAHQLEVTVQQIDSFKREQGLAPEGPAGTSPTGIDLRDEDDALIAAELEADEARAAEEAVKAAEEARIAEEAAREAGDADEAEEAAPDNGGAATPAPRRRGGRGRGRGSKALEGSFDHGEEGYGLWLDPAVADDPVYAEHWAGHRPVEVTIEEDMIVIRRAGDSDAD